MPIAAQETLAARGCADRFEALLLQLLGRRATAGRSPAAPHARQRGCHVVGLRRVVGQQLRVGAIEVLLQLVEQVRPWLVVAVGRLGAPCDFR